MSEQHIMLGRGTEDIHLKTFLTLIDNVQYCHKSMNAGLVLLFGCGVWREQEVMPADQEKWR